MSRSANFFAQSFASAAPVPSTSKLVQPISLSSILKPNTTEPTISDLSSRLDEAVAALSQESTFSDSDDCRDYSSEYDEEYWEVEGEEGFSTPSSSVSSIHTSFPLKPALRSAHSTGSEGRKASFSEEPPKVARTYSASEYSRAGPTPKRTNYKCYLESLERKEESRDCARDTLVEDREEEGNGEARQEEDDDVSGLTLCRFPSKSKRAADT